MTSTSIESKMMQGGTSGVTSSSRDGVDGSQSASPLGSEGARSNGAVSDWAPTVPPLEHLPPSNLESYLPGSLPSSLASSTKTRYLPTSKPFNLPLNANQESMRYSLARLLSRPRFASFLSTPLGFSQFKAYLSENVDPDLVAQLDLWHDLNILRSLKMATAFAGGGIARVYEDEMTKMPESVARELHLALRSTATEATSGSLDGPAKHLLDTFYAHQFESFMRSRLVEHAQERLSKYHLRSSEDRSGIGEAYVLVNPRLRDRPIVLVSAGFEKLTGYRATQIIGRNCRFLQGKSTSPAAVQAIKQAVDSGTDITQLILNYTADARPFMNLLTMIALHDVNGNLTYIVGGQSDLTDAMTSPTGVISPLQTGEDVFNTDVNELSEPVLMEAREAASTRDTSLAIEFPAVPGTSTPAEKEEVGSQHPMLEKVKNFYHKVIGKTATRPEVAIEEPQGPLVPPPSVLKAHKAVDSIASDYSSTYDKLLIVKQSNRDILFATSGFLRFIGLPSATKQDVLLSPLIHLDLLDIIVAPNNPKDQAAKEIRDKVQSVIAHGEQASFSCGVRYRGTRSKQPLSPVVVCRLYISPLRDMFGEAAASTVVLA